LIHTESSILGIGKANIVRNGDHMLILSIGPIIKEGIEAANILESQGISVAVVSMGSIKPIDKTNLKRFAMQFKTWITLEEHSIIGGLGSAILEWLNEAGVKDIDVIRLGTKDKFIHKLGSQSYVRKEAGIDKDSIVKRIKSITY